MAKLIAVGVMVPDTYPENSPVEVVYPVAYYAQARAAGGMVEGRLGGGIEGFRPILTKTGNGPLLIYGGEIGDPLPPLVQIRIKPRAAGVKGMDWHVEGHPRDTGGGHWDGSAIGQGDSRQTIVTEDQRLNILDATQEARDAAISARTATDAAGAAIQRATTIADSLSASGLLYLGSDSDGAAMLATIPPRADIVYQTTNDWGLVGTMTAPVLIIGETK